MLTFQPAFGATTSGFTFGNSEKKPRFTYEKRNQLIAASKLNKALAKGEVPSETAPATLETAEQRLQERLAELGKFKARIEERIQQLQGTSQGFRRVGVDTNQETLGRLHRKQWGLQRMLQTVNRFMGQKTPQAE